MPCDRIDLPDGYVIVCSERRRAKRCSVCGRPGDLLCDYPLRGAKAGKTCDRPLCAKCTRRQAPASSPNGTDSTDYCPPHDAEARAERERSVRRPRVSLVVQSARVSYAGPDRFDVTRKSGGPAGAPFAPSWDILRRVLTARAEADAARQRGADLESEEIERGAWTTYRRVYLDEMRQSYRAHADAWRRLLDRPRVVLVCFCPSSEQCHRGLLRAVILPTLGAVDGGELVVAPKPDPQLTIDSITRSKGTTP